MRQPSETISEAVQGYSEIVARLSAQSDYLHGHVFALRESLADTEVFRVYAELHIEPSVDALAERLVKSRGGPRNFGTARTAAKMMISSALMLALRQELLREKDPGPSDFASEFRDMSYWLSLGLSDDPDLSNRSPKKKSG